MKKLLAALSLLVFMTGCSFTKDLDNTPTKKVEELLNRYQTLDVSVLEDLNSVMNKETSFTDEQKEKYKDIIKSNYQKMTYTIKDAEEDGEEATVTAEIEVVDYTTILNDAKTYLDEHPDEFLTDDEHDESKYNDYRIDKLKDAKDKVKYTIDFHLTKVDDEWEVDDLDNEIRDKINGTYEK